MMKMNRLKKLILIGIPAIILFSFFLIPRTSAQEWVYNGVNTEKIEGFSVYPSEWYIWNTTGNPTYYPDENLTIFEIVKGNMTDYYMGMTDWPSPYGTLTNGTSIFLKTYWLNTTSGEKYALPPAPNLVQLCWWNETVGFLGWYSPMIPVDDNGKVTEQILNYTAISMATISEVVGSINFEKSQIYPNIYSLKLWNESYNEAYFCSNYTEDGILTKMDWYLLPIMPNMTLYSQPAQQPPDIDLATKDGILTVNITDITLNISITDVDNNNDGDTDVDYLFRILNGSEWTDWTTPPGLLNWTLNATEAANCTVTIEVQNMYGVTQKQITIEYVPPPEGIIPGYPIIPLSIAFTFGISIVVYFSRKKLKTHKTKI